MFFASVSFVFVNTPATQGFAILSAGVVFSRRITNCMYTNFSPWLLVPLAMLIISLNSYLFPSSRIKGSPLYIHPNRFNRENLKDNKVIFEFVILACV